MKDYKVKIEYRHLRELVNYLNEMHLQPQDERQYMAISILEEMAKTWRKKLIDRKKEYTITLKAYQAIALRYFLRIVQPEAASAGDIDFAFVCYATADELSRKLPHFVHKLTPPIGS